MTLATEFTLRLPQWLLDALPTEPTHLPTVEEQMAYVHSLADRNWRAGNGGPFAAIVVDDATGEVISAGVNVVLSRNISSGHGEVLALGLAQARLGTWNLGVSRALTLVVNWRPCAQCYGAALWSGVRRLVVAGEGPELEQITGFDEGPMVADWAEQFEGRGITVVKDVLREEALDVYRAYAASNPLVYNARGGAE